MKKRAVAYVRVSTKVKGLHSFETQEEYWRTAISVMPNYEFVGIFADKGISGHYMKNRKQLLEMLQLAKEGAFDTIYVKSVSRFGRNAEELITTVRELRKYGVNVVFENENIDTRTSTSELYLQIASAIAEDQLKTYSQNQKWAVCKRFASGKNIVTCKNYGYDKRDGQLFINQEEAKVVRLIFDLYCNGWGTNKIAFELTNREIPNPQGTFEWSRSTVRNIICNEKYAGNTLLRKTLQTMGVRYRNLGQEDQYFVENSHDAIITQEVYKKVCNLRERRGILVEMPKAPYAFSHKIKCGLCGSTFVHKVNNAGTPYKKGVWRCNVYLSKGKKVCDSHGIFDEVLEPLFVEAYNEFVLNKKAVKFDSGLMKRKKELLEQEAELRKINIKRLISEKEYKDAMAELLAEIAQIDKAIKRQALGVTNLRGLSKIDEFDATKVDDYLQNIVINDWTIIFTFCNGYMVTKTYTNGKAGNKKGWMNKQGGKSGDE